MIKQRLVGFVVIAALTIIFLPIVFIAPQEEDQLVLPVFEMPPKPSLKALPRVKPATRERAKFDEQGLPISWVLQVAALSSELRADEIAQFLRDKKYKAYVSSVYLKNQELFRVMIGPSLQKTRLEEFKVLIDEYFLVNSVIVPFSVDG